MIYHVALDVKQRHLLELQETRGDCWDLFFRHVVPRLKEGEPECRMALSTVALDKDLQESA